MKWLCAIILFSLCGCSVTMSVSGRLSEIDGSATQLQQATAELGKIKSVVNALSDELQSAPPDINAVDAVLNKYGIRRGTNAATVPQQ